MLCDFCEKEVKVWIKPAVKSRKLSDLKFAALMEKICFPTLGYILIPYFRVHPVQGYQDFVF